MIAEPRILAVGEEPPPMDGPRPERNGRQHREAKRKPDAARRQTGERFALLNAFVDFTMARLTPAERAVWLILWRDTKPDGLARTSQTDMARRAGVTDRMVRYALAGLERRGLVTVVCRGRLQTGPSSYRVLSLEPVHT